MFAFYLAVFGEIYTVAEIKKLLGVLISSWRFSSWDLVKTCPAITGFIVPLQGSLQLLTHTHPHTSHFLTPADPSTPMCVTQGGDSQRWRCRHEGTQAISICLCSPGFSLLHVCLFLFLCGLCSLLLCDPLTHDLIGPWQPSKHFPISQWHLQHNIWLGYV